jgi:endonuclease V-like protein UPF0215 family
LTRRFTVKKEIRSLGIDLCNPMRVIGAVVRGGLFLDGIVVFSPKPNQWNASIAKVVIRTRFYPELKLIMTHDPEQSLDIRKIESMTRLPVIEVRASTRGIRLNGFRRFRVARKELYARSSLETTIVQEVLERSWTTGSLPESLRIAHLIAKSRFLWKNALFQANK